MPGGFSFKSWQERRGRDGFGRVRLGKARHGMAGKAWLVRARSIWASRGTAGTLGRAWQERLGKARPGGAGCGKVRYGVVRQDWLGSVRFGPA